MFNMTERGIQGGMSVITHRLAQTNYKYLSEKYDTELPDSYCVYLDANNFMDGDCLSMPQCNLHFLERSEIDQLDVMNVSDDAGEGYILEVDLSYPDAFMTFITIYPWHPNDVT